MKPVGFVFSASLLLAVPAIARGGMGTIEGTVRTAEGKVVVGAAVKVHGPELAATTDDKGAYLVKDVPSGAELVVTASLGGIVAPPAKVWVVAGRNVVDFVLTPTFRSDISIDAEIPC